MSQHEILFIIVSYLVGSVPFGFLLYFLTEKKDIRKEGSGNIGATNILRTKGKGAGVITLILDMIKGIIAVAYGLKHFDSPAIIILGGAAVIIGHLFPLYLKFKGGKGIASLVGVLLVFHYPSAIIFGCAFIMTLLAFRTVSAASIAGVCAVFFSILFTQVAEVSVVVLVTVILIIIKHRGNIKRLVEGTEDVFSWKKTEEKTGRSNG